MDGHHARLRPFKEDLLGSLEGKVLEIGPGGGGNLEFLTGREIRWIGLEPNPYFAPYITAMSQNFQVHTELLEGSAEEIPLADESVDAVLSTLVLCSVPDTVRALGEIKRVLRPGGKLILIEHVAAQPETWLHQAQSLLTPLWSHFADGCQLCRNLEKQVHRVGFAEYQLETHALPIPMVSPHLVGWVRKAGAAS
jgi:ubiquinone/menaquinone biosynthesis C-methylase UbiE